MVHARDVAINDGNGKNEVVEVITLYQGAVDSRDGEDNKFIAKLDASGKSVQVFEPTPKLFSNNVDAMHQLEGGDMCEKTKMAHQIQATALLRQSGVTNAKTIPKSKILLFPEGIECTTDIYNSSETLQLRGPALRKARTRTKPDSAGNPTEGQAAYVFWKMAVKGSRKVVTETVADMLPDIDDINLRMEQAALFD